MRFFFSYYLRILIIVFPSISLAVDQSETVIILNLEKAINLALTFNNLLIDMSDDISTAEMNEQISKAEFDFKTTPRGDTGYTAGGGDKTGMKIGAGLDISKKTSLGTLISIYPSLYKNGNKFHSAVQGHVIQPLCKGFGKDYNFSEIKTAEFRYRTLNPSSVISL